MEDITPFIGGTYIFFKSAAAANNTALNARMQSISGSLTGIGSMGPVESKDYTQFKSYMTSYLNKIYSIAESMRNAELNYISHYIDLIKNNEELKVIVDENVLNGLNALREGRITEENYKKMIVALNAIKYKESLEKFREVIEEQAGNIETIKTNLKLLKDADTESYNEIAQLYETNYGRYIDKYTNDVSERLKDEFKKIQKTQLESLAEKINNALKALAEFPNINDIMANIWNNYADSKEAIITDDEYTRDIVEQVVRSVMKNPDETPKNIIQNLIDQMNINPEEIFKSQNNQAIKAFIKRNNESTFEEIITNNNRIISKVLKDADNAEELIEHICGDDKKKAYYLIRDLNTIRERIANVPKSRQDKVLRALDDEFSLRARLTHTEHMEEYKKFRAEKISLRQLKEEKFIIKPEKVIEGLRGKLQIRIKKSSLAELVPLYQNELVAIVFNELPGSLNMKDDIYSAIRLTGAIEVDDEKIDAELQPVITDIEKAIREYLQNYIMDYASREKGSKEKKGTTNVKRARELYVEKMTSLYESIEKIVKQYPTLMNAIKNFSETSETFLESISVKDYTLYNDEIGFHAGTLGPKFKPGDEHLKALENIHTMYEKGGISTIDLATLEFAILNCSPYAIGAGLKPALESYLLGGAALMVFDEGYGSAVEYLKNMEPTIKKLMPKNLNLYFLNQAYIPASYILTSIYTNLSKFYYTELNEGYEDFMERNKVIITNNAGPELIPKEGSLQQKFEATASAAWAQIDIQFIFMAGMLEIFKNLGQAFNVKT